MADRNSTVSNLGTFAHSIRYKQLDVAELASNLRLVVRESSNATLSTAEYSDARTAAAKLEAAVNALNEAADLLAAIAEAAR